VRGTISSATDRLAATCGTAASTGAACSGGWRFSIPPPIQKARNPRIARKTSVEEDRYRAMTVPFTIKTGHAATVGLHARPEPVP